MVVLSEAYAVLGVAAWSGSAEVRLAHQDVLAAWDPERHVGDERLLRKARDKIAAANHALALIRAAGFPSMAPEPPVDSKSERRQAPPPPPRPQPKTTSPPKPAAVDASVVELIRLATIVREHRLWPDSVVSKARSEMIAGCGRVLTLEDICMKYDPEAVFRAATSVIKDRTAQIEEANERMGHGSPCHACRAPRKRDDPEYEFGLAQILDKKTNWGGALAMLAVNVVTVPLGVAVGARPGSTTSARIARCRLVLCSRCGEERRGFFGGLKVSEADCRRHPSWTRLHSQGFTTFLDHERLARFK